MGRAVDRLRGRIRNAVSLGGDSDTLAAISGPIAEAMHGVPGGLVAAVNERYLTEAPDISDREHGQERRAWADRRIYERALRDGRR